MHTAPAWTFEHSVKCSTSCQFAWTYWTDITNWNDPPAKFELDGPFAVGSRLTTTLPDQTLHSVIRYVEPGYAATIEMQLPDGILSFNWTFEDLSETRSRIYAAARTLNRGCRFSRSSQYARTDSAARDGEVDSGNRAMRL